MHVSFAWLRLLKTILYLLQIEQVNYFVIVLDIITTLYYNLVLSWKGVMFSHFIGLIGGILVLVGFYNVERKRWKADDINLYITNLAGAVFLTISLLENFNLGSMVIEIFYATISIRGLIRLKGKTKWW